MSVRSKLEDRYYTSVVDFSKDLSRVLSSEIGVHSADDIQDLSMQISGRASATELSQDQREKRKLAKRILRAIEVALKGAVRKSGELSGRPYEKELMEMERSLHSRRGSLADSLEDPNQRAKGSVEATMTPGVNGDAHASDDDANEETAHDGHASNSDGDAMVLVEVEANAVKPPNGVAVTDKNGVDPRPQDGDETSVAESSHPADLAHSPPASTNGIRKDGDSHAPISAGKRALPALEPISPPMSYDGGHGAQASVGIPWYLEPFAITGTTVHDEAWTGREVLRGMSEQLSEIDDEELEGLGGIELEQQQQQQRQRATKPTDATRSPAKPAAGRHKTRSGKQRRRGFK